MADRIELRTMFDSVAGTYHDSRPRYPLELFERLVTMADVDAPSDLLEVGCGTGIATIPLAERGHRITAIELGADLALEARLNLAEFSATTIVNESFEAWSPPTWGAFDLVFSASAWHWPDPVIKYQLAHRHLRPGGALAFWSASHVFPLDGDPFFVELQDVYDQIGESLPTDTVFPRPGELPTHEAEIAATGLFEVVVVEQFDWETSYDVTTFIALLNTFSGHIAMEPRKRERLYSEIRRRLAERPHGTVRRHSDARLHVARRR